MPKIPSPLKWPGGKSYLAKEIVKMMPRHLHYVEPYAGGLSVLLARDPNDESLWLGDTSSTRGVSEVVNDLNKQLTNFWRVLQNPIGFSVFKRHIEATPFSKSEWQDTENLLGESNSVKAAIGFFIRCRMSLAGRMQSFTGITKGRTRGGRNAEVNAWLSAVEGLPQVFVRLRDVLILNIPALHVITGQDGPHTLFYLDPPYLHETRATTTEYGQFEMSYDDHHQLLHTLGKIEGKFLLSGYRSQLYDLAAEVYKWQRKEFVLPNNAASGKEKRRMTECVWYNF